MSARILKIAVPTVLVLAIFVGSNAQISNAFKVGKETQPALIGGTDGFRQLPSAGNGLGDGFIRRANFLSNGSLTIPRLKIDFVDKTDATLRADENIIHPDKLDGLKLRATIDPRSGEYRISGVLDYKDTPDNNTEIAHEIDAALFQDRSSVEFVLTHRDKSTQVTHSVSRTLTVDRIGPKLERVNVFGNADDSTLVLSFAESDLNQEAAGVADFYEVTPLGKGRVPGDSAVANIIATYEGRNQVHLKLPPLAEGAYQLTFKNANQKHLVDNVGNQIQNADVPHYFHITSREQPIHVEYPEFLPTQRSKAQDINPGDKVVTKVVRLYYFRDADRVAQIINRTTRSLNHAAVTQAQRRAEDARLTADELRDERRAKEREAVRVATELRRLEHEVDATKKLQRKDRELSAIKQAHEKDIEELKADRDSLPPEDTASDEEKARRAELTRRIAELERDSERIDIQRTREGLTNVDAELQALEQQAADLRAEASRTNEESIDAQAKEDRARDSQFRLEVASAHADPDTYAAGKIESVDPVARVSVSVIGTGLIQLRGPQEGINTIRTMVHQIDAPVGQVKVDIATVQLNGERGEKLERAVTDSEAYVDLGRFLTSQSLLYLRQAIQQEAFRIAEENEQGQHFQVDRDRKYLYHWFGRDFIDELYEMDSEFLNSENKILSLHSMDTVSLHRALFILALAKNDIRHNVLANFTNLIQTELPQAEFDYRRASELRPHRTHKRLAIFNHTRLPLTDKSHQEQHIQEAVFRNAAQRYHFRNFHTFFGSGFGCSSLGAGSDSINPMQREFIRLAQIFKARLITELELKQRIIERTMIEDQRLEDIATEEQSKNILRNSVLQSIQKLQLARVSISKQLAVKRAAAQALVGEVKLIMDGIQERQTAFKHVLKSLPKTRAEIENIDELEQLTSVREVEAYSQRLRSMVSDFDRDIHQLSQYWVESNDTDVLLAYLPTWESERLQLMQDLDRLQQGVDAVRGDPDQYTAAQGLKMIAGQRAIDVNAQFSWLTIPKGADETQRKDALLRTIARTVDAWSVLEQSFQQVIVATDPTNFDFKTVVIGHSRIVRVLERLAVNEQTKALLEISTSIFSAARGLNELEAEYHNADTLLKQSRTSLERRKLLDFLIEEQEERLIDLLEGTRQQIATVDNYLKRLSIALEDDFKIQFYEPSFIGVRNAARRHQVTLGNIERTSVLTNNRALAKVLPTATMEFDLPKRRIAIVEAFEGAKALASDYGALLQDPTFLSAFQLLGGAQPNGKAASVLPGLPTSLDEYQMGYTGRENTRNGSALEGLIPDPSIYKIETGTGYEIRPVIQPDGDSIVYDFNYMYTTDIREPVRADEKHLGRVKRHFLNTQVQTSSYELREVSRYQVALKVARTGQGVPLLQDIPVVGVAFRPLPSAESSIQQNIILGRSVVYPTLFD
ncbi:MAG: hypothetical protein KDB27_25570, partial [Planctomycetales bacterium]|nr:hypothetical protein [Planctomycetales bacterium]